MISSLGFELDVLSVLVWRRRHEFINNEVIKMDSKYYLKPITTRHFFTKDMITYEEQILTSTSTYKIYFQFINSSNEINFNTI